ncbi:unnamed protein product [Haemonchus placei]|uniref:Ion_trans domain-containing protein n=1 Tax=Haemonchus placei TaxID=6290 RepID=A0A0N4VTS3_HAEPC|nr:unnamed protein product [Haemonchus placei]
MLYLYETSKIETTKRSQSANRLAIRTMWIILDATVLDGTSGFMDS